MTPFSQSLTHVVQLLVLLLGVYSSKAEDPLAKLEKLAEAEPSPFVIVEASGRDSKSRAQGVVISPNGHVLSCGHIAWIEKDKSFTDKFRISFRGTEEKFPGKPAHVHKTIFNDREDANFFEHYFPAKLLKQEDTRFINKGDLAIFQLPKGGNYSKMDFFSKERPALNSGETLHLCHFPFPHKKADPTFLMNPVKVVGVTKTSSGLQYLAQGYYRIGSSGGSLLKDGKIIGIQSAAYTINKKEPGETPYGLISFQLVWSDLFRDTLSQTTEDKKGR